MAINTKYSYKAYPYHGLSFKGEPAEDFNNSEIVGSCFYQEWVKDGDTMKDIFPAGMTGVTFVGCNLDNVLVPPGNTIQDCTNLRIRVQNDLEDWIVNNAEKPVEPVHRKRFEDLGLSIRPQDIPTTFIRKEVLLLDKYNLIKADASFTEWWSGPISVVKTEPILVEGIQKTLVTIEGEGHFILAGKKARHCENMSVTKAKILEMKT